MMMEIYSPSHPTEDDDFDNSEINNDSDKSNFLSIVLDRNALEISCDETVPFSILSDMSSTNTFGFYKPGINSPPCLDKRDQYCSDESRSISRSNSKSILFHNENDGDYKNRMSPSIGINHRSLSRSKSPADKLLSDVIANDNFNKEFIFTSEPKQDSNQDQRKFISYGFSSHKIFLDEITANKKEFDGNRNENCGDRRRRKFSYEKRNLNNIANDVNCSFVRYGPSKEYIPKNKEINPINEGLMRLLPNKEINSINDSLMRYLPHNNNRRIYNKDFDPINDRLPKYGPLKNNVRDYNEDFNPINDRLPKYGPLNNNVRDYNEDFDSINDRLPKYGPLNDNVRDYDEDFDPINERPLRYEPLQKNECDYHEDSDLRNNLPNRNQRCFVDEQDMENIFTIENSTHLNDDWKQNYIPYCDGNIGVSEMRIKSWDKEECEDEKRLLSRDGSWDQNSDKRDVDRNIGDSCMEFGENNSLNQNSSYFGRRRDRHVSHSEQMPRNNPWEQNQPNFINLPQNPPNNWDSQMGDRLENHHRREISHMSDTEDGRIQMLEDNHFNNPRDWNEHSVNAPKSSEDGLMHRNNAQTTMETKRLEFLDKSAEVFGAWGSGAVDHEIGTFGSEMRCPPMPHNQFRSNCVSPRSFSDPQLDGPPFPSQFSNNLPNTAARYNNEAPMMYPSMPAPMDYCERPPCIVSHGIYAESQIPLPPSPPMNIPLPMSPPQPPPPSDYILSFIPPPPPDTPRKASKPRTVRRDPSTITVNQSRPSSNIKDSHSNQSNFKQPSGVPLSSTNAAPVSLDALFNSGNFLETLLNKAGLSSDGLRLLPDLGQEASKSVNDTFHHILKTAATSVISRLVETSQTKAPPERICEVSEGMSMSPPSPPSLSSSPLLSPMEPHSEYIPPPMPTYADAQTNNKTTTSVTVNKNVTSATKLTEIDENKRNRKEFKSVLDWQERVALEVKLFLKPAFVSRAIDKNEYKDIMKRCVNKISKSGVTEINTDKISKFVLAYVDKYSKNKKLRHQNSTVSSTKPINAGMTHTNTATSTNNKIRCD